MSASQIFEKFLLLTIPFEMPPVWARIAVDPDARVTRSSPNSLVRILQTHFPIDELRASRVVVDGADGRPTLHPLLRRPGTPVLGLRDAESGDFFDLLTPGGLLGSDEPSAFAAMQDEHTLSAMDVWGDELPSLLLAADLREVIVLRSLGFPAALMDHLDDMGEAFVDRFEYLFGDRHDAMEEEEEEEENTEEPPAMPDTAPAPAPAQPSAAGPVPANPAPVPDDDDDNDDYDEEEDDDATADDRPGIMLVGWSLSTLEFVQPEVCQNVVRAFSDLQNRQPKFDGQRVLVWNPIPDEGGKLRLACECGAIVDVQRAMVASTEGHASDLDDLKMRIARPPATPIDTLAAAIEQVQSAFAASRSDLTAPRRQQEAVAEYRRIVQRDLVRPVLDMIETVDAIDRNALATNALQLTRYYEVALEQLVDDAQRIKQKGPEPRDPAKFKMQNTMADDIQKSLKHLKKCIQLPMIVRRR